MDELAGLAGLYGRSQIAGALEVFAAGDPFAGLTLSKGDRIELLAIRRLDGDDAASALCEVRQSHPGLNRFLPDIAVNRHAEEGIGPVDGQTAVHDMSAAVQKPMRCALKIGGAD